MSLSLSLEEIEKVIPIPDGLMSHLKLKALSKKDILDCTSLQEESDRAVIFYLDFLFPSDWNPFGKKQFCSYTRV